LLALC